MEPTIEEIDQMIRSHNLEAVRALGADSVYPLIVLAAQGWNTDGGLTAIQLLEYQCREGEIAVPGIMRALQSADWDTFARAIKALEIVFPIRPVPEAIPLLLERLHIINSSHSFGEGEARRTIGDFLVSREVYAQVIPFVCKELRTESSNLHAEARHLLWKIARNYSLPYAAEVLVESVLSLPQEGIHSLVRNTQLYNVPFYLVGLAEKFPHLEKIMEAILRVNDHLDLLPKERHANIIKCILDSSHSLSDKQKTDIAETLFRRLIDYDLRSENHEIVIKLFGRTPWLVQFVMKEMEARETEEKQPEPGLYAAFDWMQPSLVAEVLRIAKEMDKTYPGFYQEKIIQIFVTRWIKNFRAEEAIEAAATAGLANFRRVMDDYLADMKKHLITESFAAERLECGRRYGEVVEAVKRKCQVVQLGGEILDGLPKPPKNLIYKAQRIGVFV